MSPSAHFPLPTDIVHHLASFLNGKDIVNFGMICKDVCSSILNDEHVWLDQIHKRFGAIDCSNQKDITELRNLYGKLSVPKESLTNFHITWLNDQYWKIKDDANSEYGKVAHLNTVCWLHFSGKLVGVLQGTYDVIWRMSFQNARGLNFNAKWIVQEEFCGEVEDLFCFDWKQEEVPADVRQEVAKGYFEWKMGTITTKHNFSTLLFEVKGGNNMWFGGWSVDYVKLVPVK